MPQCLERLMQAPRSVYGHILIASEIESAAEKLENELQGFRVVKFVEENFKIEHTKLVTAEAYISEADTKYIIIAAREFTDVAQNALLKLLEEPPKNIEFIIISPTKSNLLPTVRSRLPIVKTEHHNTNIALDLQLSKLDYKKVFAFLKEHARVGKAEAKSLVEAIFYQASVVEKLILTQRQLDNFDKAYRLIDLNSRPQSVLAMLLMSFAQEH